MEAAVIPFCREPDCSCAYHVQINTGEAASQVCSRLNSRGMVAIFPECSLAAFSRIVFLAGTPGHQLDHGRDIVFVAIILHQHVHVLCDRIIQNLDPEPFSGLIKPGNESLAIVSKLQQEFLFMASVRDVPDAPWHEVSIGSGHKPLLFRVIPTCNLVIGLILTPKNRPIGVAQGLNLDLFPIVSTSCLGPTPAYFTLLPRDA